MKKNIILLLFLNLSARGNNIIVFPDESRELVFDTIELTRKLKCTDINAFTFTPYHGTSLRGLCEKKKYLDKNTLAHIYYKDSLLRMPSISKEEIRGLMKTFVLYARLPRSQWKDIKSAEKDTEEGNNKYKELMNLFRKEYSHNALASEDGM